MVKNISKSIFRKMGYEFRKIQDLQPNVHLTQNTKNLIVEFIGPPGVGKTTHFLEFSRYTLLEFLNGRLLEVPENKIINEYVKDYHIAILKRKNIQLLNNDYSNFEMLKYLKYFIESVYIDINCLHYEGLIIKEHGIFHNFTDEFIELANLNPDLFNASLNNRVFINITGEPERIYNQIMERYIKTNKILLEHKTNKKEILRITRNTILQALTLLDLIQKRNKPCLTLEIENGLNKNIRLIDSFLNKQIASEDSSSNKNRCHKRNEYEQQ